MSFSSEVKEELSHVDGHEKSLHDCGTCRNYWTLWKKSNVKMEDILSFFTRKMYQ